MNIQIDPSQIETSINHHINAAVDKALSGYEVKEAISSKLTSDIANGVIGEALGKAMASIDTQTLTQRLAEEIQKAMTSAVINLLHNGLTEVILRIRGMNEYSQGYKEARKHIWASITSDRKA